MLLNFDQIYLLISKKLFSRLPWSRIFVCPPRHTVRLSIVSLRKVLFGATRIRIHNLLIHRQECKPFDHRICTCHIDSFGSYIINCQHFHLILHEVSMASHLMYTCIFTFRCLPDDRDLCIRKCTILISDLLR